jgi:hypothetical protein
VSRPRGLPKTGGRQKGVANKRTREIADAAIKEGLTPLEYMLAVLRDETADPERRDEMAKAAAPYIHPRLASIEASHRIKSDVRDLSDAELVAIASSTGIAEEAGGEGEYRGVH